METRVAPRLSACVACVALLGSSAFWVQGLVFTGNCVPRAGYRAGANRVSSPLLDDTPLGAPGSSTKNCW
jgi:hypothetical protein